MRGPGILTRYVAREVLQYTLLGLAAISLILLVRNLGRFLDELLGSGFAAADLLLLCRVLVTMLLVYALPVSLLFGVLLAIGRMAADVEIVAMRACGVGLRHFVRPILVLGVLVSAITWHLSRDVEPAARREMRSAVASLVARGAGLEPGRFQRFSDVLVYVDERSGDRLHGVVVSDHRDPDRPLLVFAPEGHLAVGPDGMELLLALEGGDIHIDSNGRPGERDVRIAFERFDYTLDLGALLGSSSVPRARDMSWHQLRTTVANLRAGSPPEHLRDEPVEYDLDLQRRVASPLAPALFALVGLPIGMRRTRGARSLGALWCAIIAFVYYGLQTFFTFLATHGWIGAALALWLPNLGFAGLAALLLRQARRASA